MNSQTPTRRFGRFTDISHRPISKAKGNEIRTETCQDMYKKLTNQEKATADRKKRELGDMMAPTVRLGEAGELELLVALSKALEWADWPERM